jgi:hypothetical protein
MIRQIIWLFCLLLIGCSQAEPVVIDVGRDVVQGVLLRTPEKAVFSVPADSISAVVVTDSILCLYYKKKQNASYLILKDMGGTGERVPVQFGSAENQVLVANYSFGNGKHLVYDPLLNKVGVVDIALAWSDSSYVPVFFKTNIVSQKVALMDDRLLYLNPDAYSPSQPHILISDAQWNCRHKEQNGHAALNVIGGEILYSSSNNKVAYCSRHEPMMELLDKELHLLKQIWFPHQMGNIIEVLLEDNRVVYYYEGKAPECFTTAASNADYIAAVFWTDEKESIVFLFDWEGNIKDGFRTSGRVEKVSLTDIGDVAYCWETDGVESSLNEYKLYPNT